MPIIWSVTWELFIKLSCLYRVIQRWELLGQVAVREEISELIAKFEWPRDEPIEVVNNGKMYTRQTDDETGLQQVVRYGIEME